MKNIKILVLLIPILASCARSTETFVSINKETQPMKHVMALSDAQTSFIHTASIPPSIFDGKVLQSTGMIQSGAHVFVIYNTAGEAVRGGLDVYDVSSFSEPVLLKSVVSESTEFADIKVKDNFVYLVGQKKGTDKNPAVLTIVNVSNKANPFIVSEMVFDDGRYATSLDIEGNLLYISVPKVGLKVVDITDPLNATLVKTEYISVQSSEEVVHHQGEPSLPEGFSLIQNVDNEWSDWYNNRHGHRYQILFKHTFPNLISGHPYFNSWQLCFDSSFPIATEGYPWNVTISQYATGKYKILPKTQNEANLWSNVYADIGWNSVLNSPLGGRRIQNIKLTTGTEDCSEGEITSTPEFSNTLFVKRFNGKSLLLGGKDSTRIVSHEAVNQKVKLIAELDDIESDAPARFIINGNELISNAAKSGLTIVKNIDTTPVVFARKSLDGSGNGLAMDTITRKIYLAQGSAGLVVLDGQSAENTKIGEFDFADDSGSANNVLYFKHNNKEFVFIADGLGGLKIVEVINH